MDGWMSENLEHQNLHLISLIRTTNGASMRIAEKIGIRLEKQLTRFDTQYWMYAIESGLPRGSS